MLHFDRVVKPRLRAPRNQRRGLHIYINIYTHTYIYTYKHIYIYIISSLPAVLSFNSVIHVYISIYTCIYIYNIYIYVYIYIYITDQPFQLCSVSIVTSSRVCARCAISPNISIHIYNTYIYMMYIHIHIYTYIYTY